MKGKQHLTLGVVAGGVLAVSSAEVSPYLPVLSFGLCAFGELYPDIDIENSIVGSAVKPVSRFINRVFGHRGFIHTPVNAFLCSFLIFLILNALSFPEPAYAAAAFFLGFMFHLLQDMLTVGGIKLFWPLPFKIRLTGFKTASNACWVMTVLLCLWTAALLIYFPGAVSTVLAGSAGIIQGVYDAVLSFINFNLSIG